MNEEAAGGACRVLGDAAARGWAGEGRALCPAHVPGRRWAHQVIRCCCCLAAVQTPRKRPRWPKWAPWRATCTATMWWTAVPPQVRHKQSRSARLHVRSAVGRARHAAAGMAHACALHPPHLPQPCSPARTACASCRASPRWAMGGWSLSARCRTTWSSSGAPCCTASTPPSPSLGSRTSKWSSAGVSLRLLGPTWLRLLPARACAACHRRCTSRRPPHPACRTDQYSDHIDGVKGYNGIVMYDVANCWVKDVSGLAGWRGRAGQAASSASAGPAATPRHPPPSSHAARVHPLPRRCAS